MARVSCKRKKRKGTNRKAVGHSFVWTVAEGPPNRSVVRRSTQMADPKLEVGIGCRASTLWWEEVQGNKFLIRRFWRRSLGSRRVRDVCRRRRKADVALTALYASEAPALCGSGLWVWVMPAESGQ